MEKWSEREGERASEENCEEGEEEAVRGVRERTSAVLK